MDIAQACYSFLFAATYASHKSPWARVIVFLAVFPVAQAIPVFAWIESLEIKPLQNAMRRIGLRPASRNRDAAKGTDSLWLAFRAKFASHSGFLAEALVEAVPQCMLQAAAGARTPARMPYAMMPPVATPDALATPRQPCA